VPRREEPIHTAGGKPGDENLKRDRHARKLLSGSGAEGRTTMRPARFELAASASAGQRSIP
jgi:hypothetical protein